MWLMLRLSSRIQDAFFSLYHDAFSIFYCGLSTTLVFCINRLKLPTRNSKKNIHSAGIWLFTPSYSVDEEYFSPTLVNNSSCFLSISSSPFLIQYINYLLPIRFLIFFSETTNNSLNFEQAWDTSLDQSHNEITQDSNELAWVKYSLCFPN